MKKTVSKEDVLKGLKTEEIMFRERAERAVKSQAELSLLEYNRIYKATIKQMNYEILFVFKRFCSVGPISSIHINLSLLADTSTAQKFYQIIQIGPLLNIKEVEMRDLPLYIHWPFKSLLYDELLSNYSESYFDE